LNRVAIGRSFAAIATRRARVAVAAVVAAAAQEAAAGTEIEAVRFLMQTSGIGPTILRQQSKAILPQNSSHGPLRHERFLVA
jgi:hypothetical protein